MSAFLRRSQAGHRDSPREGLRGCQPYEGLSRATVELGGHCVEVFRGMSREITPLGKVLPQEPVHEWETWEGSDHEGAAAVRIRRFARSVIL
jgi:hypothetical protein